MILLSDENQVVLNQVTCFILIGLKVTHMHIHTYVGLENIPFSAKALLILLMSVFFCKKSAFFGKNGTLTQGNSLRAVLEIV